MLVKITPSASVLDHLQNVGLNENDEYALIELQGQLNATKEGESFNGLHVGELEIEDGNAKLFVGGHICVISNCILKYTTNIKHDEAGKIVNLKNPLAIIEQDNSIESQVSSKDDNSMSRTMDMEKKNDDTTNIQPNISKYIIKGVVTKKILFESRPFVQATRYTFFCNLVN